jgi:hypothetical protein
VFEFHKNFARASLQASVAQTHQCLAANAKTNLIPRCFKREDDHHARGWRAKMQKLYAALIIAIAIAGSPQLAFAKKAGSTTTTTSSRTTTEKSHHKVTVGKYYGKLTIEKKSKEYLQTK